MFQDLPSLSATKDFPSSLILPGMLTVFMDALAEPASGFMVSCAKDMVERVMVERKAVASAISNIRFIRSPGSELEKA